MTNIVITGDDNQVAVSNGNILQQKICHLPSGKNVFRAIGNWITLLAIGLLVTGIGYMTVVLISG